MVTVTYKEAKETNLDIKAALCSENDFKIERGDKKRNRGARLIPLLRSVSGHLAHGCGGEILVRATKQR